MGTAGGIGGRGRAGAGSRRRRGADTGAGVRRELRRRADRAGQVPGEAAPAVHPRPRSRRRGGGDGRGRGRLRHGSAGGRAVRDGGYAEAVTAPAAVTARIPDSMPYETAAGFMVAYGDRAHRPCASRRGCARARTLLVHGAGGGVGLAAVEVGKAMGATVIATAGSADKRSLAKAHGAAHVIDYRAGRVQGRGQGAHRRPRRGRHLRPRRRQGLRPIDALHRMGRPAARESASRRGDIPGTSRPGSCW